MWFLKADNDGRLFYFGNKTEVYIGRGRETCALALLKDTSISRRHAVLRTDDSRLTLQDLGSTHKTFLNSSETPLDPKIPITLSPKDKIKFGIMNNVWTVHEISFITCTSTIKGENLNEIQTNLNAVGGTIVSDWNESVTHLTMPAIQMTIKVLQALAYARPIVTPDFWTACHQAVTGNQLLPEPRQYLPPTIETSINTENVSFAPNESRRTIFAGKKFIFFSRRQMSVYRSVLLHCSGAVALLSECKMTKSKLCADDIVVVQFSPAMTGQETQSQQQVIGDIISYLSKKSRRVVPDLEISLAILYCSTEKYCNTKLNVPMQILNACNQPKKADPTSVILAPETQDVVAKRMNKPDIVIDQSLVSLRNDDAEEDLFVSPAPKCPQTSFERTKRKIDSIEDENEHAPKRSAVNTTSLCTTEDSMFEFVEEQSKAVTQTPTKPIEKKLSFMKAKSRKNANDNLEENIFDFLPDKKDTEKPSPENSTSKQGLFQNNANKRKPEHIDLPNAKKAHIELSSRASSLKMSELKTDISELLKKSFWKSCSDETAKKEVVKKEPSDDQENIKSDIGTTVVTNRNDLIKKEVTLLINGSYSNTGSNFKKFKKVLPLRMQVTVTRTVMSVYRSETRVDTDKDGHSSEEEPEIWIPNKDKSRKCHVR